jgi:hypothetical protein
MPLGVQLSRARWVVRARRAIAADRHGHLVFDLGWGAGVNSGRPRLVAPWAVRPPARPVPRVFQSAGGLR